MHAFFTLLTFAQLAFAEPAHRFYANPSIQEQAPAAFALQPEGLRSVRLIAESAGSEREAFLMELDKDQALLAQLKSFELLEESDRLEVLRKVFQVEVRALGIEAPELVIADDSTPGPAFFDFDLSKPGPGRVLLNPKELRKLPPYAALSLLLHETRHSAQLQLALRSNSPLALGYRAAFQAQKALRGMSFCDFTTLLHEYEAFQFASYVLHDLKPFVDLVDMGSFASQYARHGRLKIDLLALESAHGDAAVLEKFNELEKVQYRQLGGKE